MNSKMFGAMSLVLSLPFSGVLHATSIGVCKEGQALVQSAEMQQGKTVTIKGVVTDAKGEELIGVNVLVKGSTTGTTTDVNGSFTLKAPSNATLVFSYVGFANKEIAVGEKTTLKVIMDDDTKSLDQVVVTALGIKREKKALSYNVQEVKSEALTTAKDANFMNSLSGKVAGLNINASASGVGGATKAVMRGAKSIEQSSNALYVIDGVPVFNFGTSGGTGTFDSKAATEAISDINSEDIESISVLTGAAAAALYGSDAANGAIVITTKKGGKDKLKVSVSSNVEAMNAFVMPRFQNRYGTSDRFLSWGNLNTEQEYYNYDPKHDFLRQGLATTEAISLSGGTEKNQIYASASALNARGIIPNNSYNRYNFSFRNSSSLMADRLKLDFSASYVIQNDRNMISQGEYNNPLVSAYLFPRGNQWSDYKLYERWDPELRKSIQYWPVGEGRHTMQNPYWIAYRMPRTNERERYALSGKASFDIKPWLNVAARIRIDNSTNKYERKAYSSTSLQLTEKSPLGLYGIANSSDKQTYGDLLVSLDRPLLPKLNLRMNLGASFSDLRYEDLTVSGPISYGEDGEFVGVSNVFNVMQLSNSATQRSQSGWREQSRSAFGTAEFGYDGLAYLTLTARNDWPSQLWGPQSKKSSFFYYSIGGSVILSQVVKLPKEISHLKLNASFASVGLPFKRFIANPQHKWDPVARVWKTDPVFPFYALDPERTNSIEMGLSANFLRHFNLGLTYYSATTYNQTFNPQLSASSGFSNIYIQAGSVRNSGVELSLGFKNQWGKFSWESNYTFSSNKNKIVHLLNDAKNPITGETIQTSYLDMGGVGDVRFILKEGQSLGELYSTSTIPQDNRGYIKVNQNGEVESTTALKDADEFVHLGSVFPKANMSWRNNFSLGHLNLSVLISARLGGIVYSRTQAVLDYHGVSKASAQARDTGGVIINDGDLVSAESWYKTIGNTGLPQFYTYDATNIRLQEASINYTISRKKLWGVGDVTIGLYARNLLMLYVKAPFDPESVASTGNYYQGLDNFLVPSTRNVGFNLRFNF